MNDICGMVVRCSMPNIATDGFTDRGVLAIGGLVVDYR